MKIIYTLITITFFLSACSSMSNAQQNQLTKEEKQEGWKLLFDGNSIDHWRGYQKESVPTAWKVKDGNLTLIPGKDGGDLISRKKYEDFVLKLDWKVEKGGNSGVFYKAMEQPTQAIYWSAPEIQVLDNKNHPDANKGENGNRKSGSLYDLIPAKPQNANPYGEWNSLKLVVKGPHIQHWQNGEMVVEYKMWDNEWYEMIRNSKFQNHPEYGDAREGYIGLQDHGDQVSFRNIKIKEL